MLGGGRFLRFFRERVRKGRRLVLATDDDREVNPAHEGRDNHCVNPVKGTDCAREASEREKEEAACGDDC